MRRFAPWSLLALGPNELWRSRVGSSRLRNTATAALPATLSTASTDSRRAFHCGACGLQVATLPWSTPSCLPHFFFGPLFYTPLFAISLFFFPSRYSLRLSIYPLRLPARSNIFLDSFVSPLPARCSFIYPGVD